MSSSEATFSYLRTLFFPIYRHEWKKFLPMMAMLSLIYFNYTILRNTKDAIVVTAAGAAVIPFIKVWVMLPTAILITYLFIKLSSKYSQERVFYLMMSGFLICYALFAFVIYPYRDELHANAFADALSSVLPKGCSGLINMVRYWSFTGFYVMSELWSSMIMTTLFWGFANEITHLDEARRFYGVLSIVGNIAGIFASESAAFLGSWIPQHSSAADGGWEAILQLLIGAVLVSGLATIVLFWRMNRTILKGEEFKDLHSSLSKHKKRKQRLSLKQSFSYLSQSKYLTSLAVIVVSYNLVINLVEIVWKDQLYQLYPSPVDYNNYMAHLTTATCLISSFAALFMPKIIETFGWTKTALITPMIMLVTCAGFFAFLFLQGFSASPLSLLAIAVFFGAAQNCFSKAAKYSVFDATKEMAFIPLDHETKLKGKAAIDGVGSRLGKSGGSLIHQGLYVIFDSLSRITPYVATILLGVILLWVSATRSLGQQFLSITEKRPPEPPQEPEAPSQPAQQLSKEWSHEPGTLHSCSATSS